MSDSWFYKLGHGEHGPVSFEEIFALAENGQLRPNDSLRQAEAEEWIRADTIEGLFRSDESSTIQDLSELDFHFVENQTTPSPKSSTQTAEETSSAEIPVSEPRTWYFMSHGIQHGPFSYAELLKRIEQGFVTFGDQVKNGEQSRWSLVDRIPELYAAIPVEEDSSAAFSSEVEDRTIEAIDFTANESSHSEIPLQSPPESEEETESESEDDLMSEDLISDILTTEEEGIEETTSTAIPADVSAPVPATSSHETETQPAHLSSSPTESKTAQTPSLAERMRAHEQAASGSDKKSKKQKKAKQKSSSGGGFSLNMDISGAFTQIRNMGFLGILFGVLLVVFVLVYGLKFFNSFDDTREYYDQLNHVYTEFKALRQKNASESEWDQFSTDTQQRLKPIINDLKKSATSKNPAAQNVYWAANEEVPKMLQDARKEPSKSEELFLRYMEVARDVMSGNTPATTDPSSEFIESESEL